MMTLRKLLPNNQCCLLLRSSYQCVVSPKFGHYVKTSLLDESGVSYVAYGRYAPTLPCRNNNFGDMDDMSGRGRVWPRISRESPFWSVMRSLRHFGKRFSHLNSLANCDALWFPVFMQSRHWEVTFSFLSLSELHSSTRKPASFFLRCGRKQHDYVKREQETLLNLVWAVSRAHHDHSSSMTTERTATLCVLTHL